MYLVEIKIPQRAELAWECGYEKYLSDSGACFILPVGPVERASHRKMQERKEPKCPSVSDAFKSWPKNLLEGHLVPPGSRDCPGSYNFGKQWQSLGWSWL